MQKNIMKSSRGLTFSFPSQGSLSIGSRYDYIINKGDNSIQITPSPSGRYKMSRKKLGVAWYSLVDLRNQEVMEALSGMEELRVSISEDRIVVSNAKARGAILAFPRSVLSDLRMAAGMDSVEAAGAIMDHAGISLSSSFGTRAVSISDVQSGLSDVYTLVSLFSGAGILDWAFAQDSRFDIRYAIDYEKAACETYRQNIGTHIVHGDVHKAFTAEGYPLDATVRDPDIIIGGPSCKPFSNANRHTRLADHPDSDLVVQYMRIVKTLRPKVFAIENVPEVLTACNGAYFDAIKEAAAECGYELGAKIVQDNLVGGYTTRKRAVILGSRIGPVSFSSLVLSSGSKTVGDALGKVDSTWSNYNDVTLPSAETRKRMSFVPQGGNYKDIPEEYQTPGKNRHSSTYRRLSMTEPSPTIVNWRKPPLVHPTEDRTLTVAEAKALHGLPGDFRICGTLGQMQQQVGNSVPVALGKYIKNALLALLKASEAGYEPVMCGV